MAARIKSQLGRVVLAIGLVAALGASAASADGLYVEFVSQDPTNVVPRAQASIDYTVRTENFDAGGDPTTIGVGIEIRVDGSRVSASSGEFTANGCSVDPSFSDYWACNNLREGSSQTIAFTWNNPAPGDSDVTFDGFCQVIPVPDGGFQACTSDNFVT
ncbi:MAG: hypothetical protein JRJ05_06420, partial [Deltaproteobacteria bacterium]|nr:hypothetical protein [Deltaproteobacteria bacterium]